MTVNLPIALMEDTIAEVESRLRHDTDAIGRIGYVYVTDQAGVLHGALTLRDVLQLPRGAVVADLIRRRRSHGPVAVRPTTGQEEVARLAIRHELRSVPVTTKDGRLVGAVDAHAIMGILHRRHVQGLLMRGGLHRAKAFSAQGYFETSLVDSIRSRLPWLVVGLGGGVVAAQVVEGFEKALEAKIILAAFIPLVVYMADAIGTQTETLIVRNLALDPTMDLLRFLKKETQSGLIVATICGLLISAYSLVRFDSPFLGVVLGPSLFAATFMSIIIGTLTPWLLFKAGRDPAYGTGPLTTILQDIASVSTYFAIATLAMG